MNKREIKRKLDNFLSTGRLHMVYLIGFIGILACLLNLFLVVIK